MLEKLPFLFLLSVVWLSQLSSVVAEEPKVVIEKAIAAHGGKERLIDRKAMRMKASGTINLGAEVPFARDITWQTPGQLKIAVEMQVAGQNLSFQQGLNGTDAWEKNKGTIVILEGRKLAELRTQLHLHRIMSLVPLLTDNSFTLTEVEDTMIDGRAAAGVKVTAAGERDVTLYFDKKSGLVARNDQVVHDAAKMEDVLQEDVLSDYREIDGVQTAFKETLWRKGVQVAVLKYSEVSYPDKVEASEFTRPMDADVPPDLAAIRTRDVIYGRKAGMALTMDVFTPNSGANGAAIIFVVSGGWVSDNQPLNKALLGPFVSEPVKRGYTVFAVFHGSQPTFTIPEAVADLHRAVRFIRAHSGDYGIDPDRIGITGGSAGGHLSLMQGTAGTWGDADSSDPVERASSRVQAVACLFPPTDFLNYGGEGRYAFGAGELLMPFRPAVDVRKLDPMTLRLERSVDEQEQLELAEKISPITHVSADDPPTLIVHGDADKLVPIQQAELILAKFKQVGVPAELITRPNRGHDLNGIEQDVADMTDWFDKHLMK